MTTMRAIVQDRYGTPDEVLHVREVEIPTPAPDEVLVQVRAASVNPDVWHAIAGYPAESSSCHNDCREKR
jgi:NADPH:quinone reductase-like Zn-dependent oxidoreductase